MQNLHEVLNKDGKILKSPDMFPPGYVLKEEIESREIAKKDFAELLDILPTHLSEIFSGKRPVSAKMAMRLETALDISAGFWLRMQLDYDLKLAEQRADPVITKIEDVLQIQQNSNTSLKKALVAYDVASAGRVVVRSGNSAIIRTGIARNAARNGSFVSVSGKTVSVNKKTIKKN